MLEITREMYERAKEVDEAEERLNKLDYWDDYTKEYIESEQLYDAFYEDFKVSKFFQPWDIVKIYEKRLNKKKGGINHV